MKRGLLFFTLAIAVVAFPQVSKAQNDAAVQERLHWISSFAMSGGLYHAHLQALGLDMKPAPPSPDLPLIPPSGGYQSYVATNDTPSQDVEPSIANLLYGGVPTITTVYMTYASAWPHLPFLHSVTTTNSFTSFTPSLAFSLPSTIQGFGAFQQAYDPNLAPDTSGNLYAVGLADTWPHYVTAVCVWRSTNGGAVWSAPTSLEDNHLDPTYDLDHPHVAVAPNGTVYVTYVQNVPHLPGTEIGLANIRMAFSTNHGGSFTQFSPPANSSGRIGGPQLAVNPTNGNLYLVWADYDLNALRVSIYNGTSWSTPVNLAIPTGRLIGPVDSQVCYIPGQGTQYQYPCLSNYIRIYSLPITRYNPVAGVLGVTWHQREDMGTANPQPTDVYYAYFDPSGNSWGTPVAISAVAGVNEFMPALDSDTSGDVNITFYNTSGYTNNLKFQEWRAFRTYRGAFGIANKVLKGGGTDPAQYTIWPYFIGDYQDGTSIRDLGYDEYVPAWVGIYGSNGEIYLTDVSY
jgi:hypothetical protein